MMNELKAFFSDKKTLLAMLLGMIVGAVLGAIAFYNGWLG